MLHTATIKAAVRKAFPSVEILGVDRHSWGIFTVKVSMEMPRSTKFGILLGETDHDRSENGVVLDENISWV